MDTSRLEEPIRPLGPCEIYSASRHALGFYKCVANTCRYSISPSSLGGQGVRDVLEAALARVVLAVPSLTVGIAGQDTSSPQFVQCSSINLEHHVEFLERAGGDPDAQDSALIGILEDQHDRSWPEIERRPPWKLTVVTPAFAPQDGLVVLDAIFAVHHAVADGRSTALFHTKLLNELNCPRGRPAQLVGGVLDVKGAGTLVRPQEELVKFSISWSFLAQTLWRELGPAWLQRQLPAAPWTGQAITRAPCRTRLRLVTVPATAVPGILAACREHQTTLTPLLHALALASLAKQLPSDEAVAFRSSTPIDLRPFVDSSSQPSGSRDVFGVLVTGQFHQFGASTMAQLRAGPSMDEIWSVATDLRRSMEQHINNIPKDDVMGLLRWVTDWKKFWLSKVGKPRQDTWEVSNIGSLPGGHAEGEEMAGGWRIGRSFMSQGATVAGAAISISVAGVAGGEISMVLGWQEGIVNTETVESLARDLQDWLGRLGQVNDND